MTTIVEGDSKAEFSIGTSPWCRRGHYSFPSIVLLCPRYMIIMLINKEVSSTISCVCVYIYIYIYIYIYKGRQKSS